MSYEEQTADVAGALDALHQLHRCPTTVDGADIDDAQFFREVRDTVQQYVNGLESESNTGFSSASGRTARYGIDDIQDALDAERADPRNEDGLPYLLSALHALNQYRSKHADTDRETPDITGDHVPVETDLY